MYGTYHSCESKPKHRISNTPNGKFESRDPWKIVQTRRTSVRGIGQRDYILKFKTSVNNLPPNPKVNFTQSSNPFRVLQVDSANKVACQSTPHRPSEVDEHSMVILQSYWLSPHKHSTRTGTACMHANTEDNNPMQDANTRTPQDFTPLPVDLTPVFIPKKQSTPNLKHGPIIRPTIHDTNTSSNSHPSLSPMESPHHPNMNPMRMPTNTHSPWTTSTT